MPSSFDKTKKNNSGKKSSRSSTSSSGTSKSAGAIVPSGYLLTCDPQVREFIKHMNEGKNVDKKFILEELDSTHLLIHGSARNEINTKVDEWMDENVFTNINSVGENLET